MKTIESAQIAGTPAQDVKEYMQDGNNVIAVFWSRVQRDAYINEFSYMQNTGNWHQETAFANFSKLDDNKIKAHSTYHTEFNLIKMFEDGLKYV
ncbi:MAG: hypothetical protein V3V84_08815 [Candidatus Bathyarchaeia archaeon]